MRYRRTLHGRDIRPPRDDLFQPPYREPEAWRLADWNDDPAGRAKRAPNVSREDEELIAGLFDQFRRRAA